jgi:hypothetical protein
LFEQFVVSVSEINLLVKCECGAGAILNVTINESKFPMCPSCRKSLGNYPGNGNAIQDYIHALGELEDLNVSLVIRKNAMHSEGRNAGDFGKIDR